MRQQGLEVKLLRLDWVLEMQLQDLEVWPLAQVWESVIRQQGLEVRQLLQD